MSSKRADISQIEKYLNGKLDAAAMHQLERQAQDDPFLMDALEGYEKAGIDEQQLHELQQRLQQRVEEKQSRIIPWRMLAIAASVLIGLTIGGLWVYNNNPHQKQPLVAQADKTLVKPSPLIQAPAIAANKKEIIEKSEPLAVLKAPDHSLARKRAIVTSSDVKPAAPAADNTVGMVSAELDKQEHPVAKNEAKDSTPLDEALVMDYAAKRKATARSARADSGINRIAAAPSQIGNLKEITAKNSIQGKVVDEMGQPLPGAIVKIKGTANTVTTNSSGGFVLKVDSTNKKDNLVISFVGYETTELMALNNTRVNVALKPNNAGLDEVVVVGYGTQKRTSLTDAAATIPAKPKDFEKYIKDNAISPDGKTGTVKLTFTVSGNGALSDFKITKSLSDQADKKAIDLVKNGPAWAGQSNGQPKTIEVKIRFHKAN